MYAAARGGAFEVDVLVRDSDTQKPRVVIELKLNPVHSDALIAYGSKAVMHRTASPSLRYGLLAVGSRRAGLTSQWFQHGDPFDFMLSWPELGSRQKSRFAEIVSEEVGVSRAIEDLAARTRGKRPSEVWRRTEMRGYR